ncbi:MAG: hypothetical protein IPF98_03250 [Gemmatimonadetes bacterium]|nr:hypothetical protein [Gemmatimonadota bacterium]MCC6771224.1 hypothetical protein [Gemmatimonadaceae bacterium]
MTTKRRSTWIGTTILLMVGGSAASSQTIVTLRAPTATLTHDFSQIRGVRELPDGRVLLTDRLEERLVVADFASGRVQVIGRPGRGPLEYHLPTSLIPMSGDSTLLIDEGNSRLVVVTPALTIARSFSLRIPGIGVALSARAVDAQGRYYLQIPGWISNARERGDSVWVVRYDLRRATVDTIALIQGATTPPNRNDRQLGIPFVPFAPQDGWAAGADGRVAIVRANEYRVDWRSADGRMSPGIAVPSDRVPVTMADRVAFTRRFIANSPIGGRDPNGGMSAAPAELLQEKTIREVAARNTFAAVMGPFTQAAPLVAIDGTLWVERSGHVGTRSTWDVFDAAGRNVRRTTLPAGRRLVALGRASAYLVATDDDGLERLERYALR